MKQILAIICAAALLIACSGRGKGKTGWVVGKAYEPPRVYCYYDATLQLPMARSYPARWLIWIADSTGVVMYQVTPEAFDTIRQGQIITYGHGKEENNSH